MKWEACSDGRGGLPTTILGTSQEARSEAIRGYTDVFGTLIDLQKDTIFISDPMFCLKKQRNLLLQMECMKLVKNAAFTTEIFQGLTDSHRYYPRRNDSPAKILRELDGLEHFSLIISEDGIGLEDAFGEGENDEEFMEVEDSENEENEENEPSGDIGSIEEGDVQASVSNPPHSIQNARDEEDEEAFEQMSKRGYFRHTGKIHFESAYESIDYGEDFEIIRSWFLLSLKKEKSLHADWRRPKVSIVEVKYGLNPIGDFHQCLHSNGDHSGGILEHTFEAESFDSESSFDDDSSGGTSDEE
jgi:hypothetical protein